MSDADPIDDLMQQAIDALTRMDYLDCEARCLRALADAHDRRAWDDYARILLPLQESRRQRRLIAADGAIRLGAADMDLAPHAVLAAVERLGEAGACLVLTPPARRADAAAIQDAARDARMYLEVLCAQPVASPSDVPVAWRVTAAAGDPPACLVPAPPADCRDRWLTRRAAATLRSRAAAWFLAAGEALGNAALAAIDPDAPPDRRMRDLRRAVDAVTDHELLHQHLFDAVARLAAATTNPARGESSQA